MPIDSSIYAQFAPKVRTQADYDAEDYQRALHQQTLQQNALGLQTGRMKADEYSRGVREQETLRNALSGLPAGASLQDRANAAMGTGLQSGYTQADALMKTAGERQKAEVEAAKGRAEAATKLVSIQRDLATRVMAMPTMESALAALQQAKAYAKALGFGDIDTSADERILAQQTTPEQIRQLFAGHALAAEKLLPQLTSTNLGSAQQFGSRDPLTGKLTVNNTAPINQSADNAATQATARAGQASVAATAAASRAQADKHFGVTQSAPKYMETDQGIVALPGRLANGQAPVGTPVVDASGVTLGKPLKALPPSVNDAIIGNAQSLYTLNKALALAGGKNVDAAVGDKNATGWKGYVPQALLNRIDGAGVDTRAEIADIGSLKIHDRSGAAVTISESPRLMPFIPQATDSNDVVVKKLTRLKEEAARMQSALSDTYSKDQGYKPSPVLSGSASAKPAQSVSSKVNNDAEYNALPSGATFVGPDGKTRRKP